MGYHLKHIEKGVLGHASKIREEYEEFADAVEQNAVVMQFVELSDLIGAIRAYTERFGVTLDDLVKMADLTKKAFEDGSRVNTSSGFIKASKIIVTDHPTHTTGGLPR